MTKRKKFVAVIATFMAAAILSVVIINLAVVYKTDENIRQTDDLGVGYDCILVLGAGLRSDGSPSDMLADRLRVAISLYKNGVSDVILLSGDCSGEDYDEVSAMYNYCVANGVPEYALVRDNYGFSTYESIYNANESGYERLIIVTQKYHLYRALYIADAFDIEALGVSANLRGYRNQAMRDIREIAARVKDFFKVL
jgi:vancomycin permeability regulator SanA